MICLLQAYSSSFHSYSPCSNQLWKGSKAKRRLPVHCLLVPKLLPYNTPLTHLLPSMTRGYQLCISALPDQIKTVITATFSNISSLRSGSDGILVFEIKQTRQRAISHLRWPSNWPKFFRYSHPVNCLLLVANPSCSYPMSLA